MGDAILTAIFLAVAILFYFAPYLQAKQKGHPQQGAIGALNLLLGWTLLGWVAALVWAYTSAEQAVPVKAIGKDQPAAPANGQIIDVDEAPVGTIEITTQDDLTNGYRRYVGTETGQQFRAPAG